MGKPFSTLFWNVWVESQTPARVNALKLRFDELIADHRPEAIGLNEVLADHNGKSELLEHLKSQGYHVSFAPFSPENSKLFSGSALASLQKPLEVHHHDLGPDRYGEVRGFPGHTVKLIQAKLPHGKRHVNVVVNYLAHLVPWNWLAHARHHRAFRRLMRAPELGRSTIIGGDFNQFKLMHHLWGAKSLYHRATGTFFHPTWKLMGGKVPIIQANYDNIFWTKCDTLHLQDFKVLDRWPSDHTPLIARFIVR
jgi:hypothetical protein